MRDISILLLWVSDWMAFLISLILLRYKMQLVYRKQVNKKYTLSEDDFQAMVPAFTRLSRTKGLGLK